MRIFCKKSIEFNNFEVKDGVMTSTDKFTVSPLVFTDAPDWIRKDKMFDWLIAEGSIEVIETKATQVKLENDPNVIAQPTQLAQPATKKPNSNFNNNYKR